MFNLLTLIIALFFDAATISVSSPAFRPNDFIPSKFTCVDQNVNPELILSGVPENTKVLALVMDDPDAPMAEGFVHWVMYNIPVTNTISENSAPGKQGQNGKQENKYTGPCPPSGTHHYHFKVYALDKKLDLKGDVTRTVLEKAMKGHILASGELIGLYKKLER